MPAQRHNALVGARYAAGLKGRKCSREVSRSSHPSLNQGPDSTSSQPILGRKSDCPAWIREWSVGAPNSALVAFSYDRKATPFGNATDQPDAGLSVMTTLIESDGASKVP